MSEKTIRLTTTQAIVKYLYNQFIEIDGEKQSLYAGVFGIFGHGNVTCLGEALYEAKEVLPTWRGQNEQSMAMAAISYTKSLNRKQIMVVTSSIGPGATNMITAAGVAHTNRLPVLFLSGDVFENRRPDPVLQQVEHFNDPTITVNDAFKPVTRYWDRITHPEQVISTLVQATRTMLDPATCGPAFIGMCQDVQGHTADFPLSFFEPVVHRIPRARPDVRDMQEAAKAISSSSRPLVISGGGVRYSGAAEVLAAFCEKHNVPICETIGGKGSFLHDHPNMLGSVGVTGTKAANDMANEADCVICVGTRLQDFTTASWSLFDSQASFVSINTAGHDAYKASGVHVIGDAKVCLEELIAKMDTNWSAHSDWLKTAQNRYTNWNNTLDALLKDKTNELPSYGQVIMSINEVVDDNDMVLTAAGGLPAELVKCWRSKSQNAFDCEFGFSCMGYEIAGGWGAAMANKDRDVIVLVGDGSYMMMNSDIYSSVLTGHKMIVVVCDNGGFAVINRLQTGKGNAPFNNQYVNCNVAKSATLDFAMHARSMGADSREVSSIEDLQEAFVWAKKNEKTAVIVITTAENKWTPGDAWWDVGMPEVSARKEVVTAYNEQIKGRKKQRLY